MEKRYWILGILAIALVVVIVLNLLFAWHIIGPQVSIVKNVSFNS